MEVYNSYKTHTHTHTRTHARAHTHTHTHTVHLVRAEAYCYLQVYHSFTSVIYGCVLVFVCVCVLKIETFYKHAEA